MEKSKRALYIQISKGYGGAERRLIRIMNELCKNYDDCFILIKGNEDMITHFSKKECIDDSRLIKCRTSLQVYKNIMKYRFGYIWFFNFDKTSLLFPLLKRILGIKLIMTVANYYYSIGIFSNYKVQKAFKFVSQYVDRFDCLYPSSASNLQNAYKKAKVTVTPIPSTKTDIFSPKNKKRSIVFAARLLAIKNPVRFLESVNLVRDIINENGYIVELCGDGPLKKNVIDYIKNHNLEEIVHYQGYINTETVLPYSSIFVAIMDGENYPSQSLIESISSGNYVIVSNEGDSYRLINDEYGVLVANNKESIAQAIKDAIQKVETNGEEVVSYAREFALSNFKMSSSVKYFEQLLELVQ